MKLHFSVRTPTSLQLALVVGFSLRLSHSHLSEHSNRCRISTRPLLDQTRLWYPPQSRVWWLKKFTHLPPVPAYFEALGKYVDVSIVLVVKVLEETRARAVPVRGRDYCTRTNVEFVVTPTSHIYTEDPPCEALKRIPDAPADVACNGWAICSPAVSACYRN